MAQRRRVRGNIERLPSGHYRAIVYAGVDPLTGRERRLKRTAETYAEAKLVLTELQRQVDQHQHPKSAITVREAIEQWLEVAELEVSTRERYEDLNRLYIEPGSATCRPARSTPSSSSGCTPGYTVAASCAAGGRRRHTRASR
jgi:integrase